MKTTQKIIGVTFLAAPFFALAAYAHHRGGWRLVGLSFGLTALLVACIAAGVTLLYKGNTPRP